MPYSGTLVSRVFTSRGQLPVQDAFVVVVARDADGLQRLLDVQISDRSGATQPVKIITTAPANSQSPDQPLPFSQCDIWVTCPGYQPLVVRNIQLFPDITSFQNLPLIPLAFPGDEMVDQVTITPQDL